MKHHPRRIPPTPRHCPARTRGPWTAGLGLALAVGLAAAAAKEPLAELLPEGLEPPPESMAGPLDQWGDWLRGAPHWRFSRRVLEAAGPCGLRAVRTEIHPRPGPDAEKSGWMVTGFTVDGAEWAGFRGLRFYCRTDHPARVRLVLYAADSVWRLNRVVAETAIAARAKWTKYTLPPARFHSANSAAPDWRRVQAVGWVLEGAPNAIELAGFRVLLPAAALRRVRAARLRRRLDQLRLDLRSLAGRGLAIPALANSADRIAGRLAAGNPPAPAVLEAVTAQLEQAERFRDAGDALFSIRRRRAHYHDFLRVLDPAGAGPLSRRLDALERRRRRLACELRIPVLAEPQPPIPTAVARLELECDQLWSRIQPLTRAAPARFRPTASGAWWRRPGGRPIVPLAAHIMATIYGNENGWRRPREADFRRLASWGFNAARIEVRYALLEPRPGRLDPAYLAMLHRVIDWADKYGIYAVIDMHWPYPDWFYNGPARRPCPHREEQNPYHRADALVATFRRLARELARHPNILAWEIPTNEPAISSIEIWPNPKNDPTIADIPALMHSWNAWLREKYRTRTALDRVWRDTPHLPARNGLGPHESWDHDSILPPGKRGVPARWNRRLYDYLEWAVHMHTRLCARIAAAIRESIPGAVVQQQPPAGGPRWERDPIPVTFFPWQQFHAPGVQVGTHYGVGHACAWISPLDMPSMNSEERTEWRKGIFARQRARNQGATAFVYFPKNGFINRRYRLKPSTAWLAAVSEFWDHAVCRFPRPVLVIVNSRLAALQAGRDGAGMRFLLERLGIDYDEAGSAYVSRNPGILRRYRAVTVSLDYADPECLAAVWKSGTPSWWFGRPGPDVRAGFGRNAIPARLARRKRFFSKAPEPAAATPDAIDLTGLWRFRTDPEDAGGKRGWAKPGADDRAWQRQAVPAYWENIGVLHKGRNYDGAAWYRRRVRIPPGWAGRRLVLEFGGIDDLDQTFVNGVKVGETGRDTPRYWEAFRRYPIPPDLLRPGPDNLIAVRVVDLRGNGGIWRAPVRLALARPRRIRFTGDFGRGLFRRGQTVAANAGAQMPVFTRSMLAPGTRVIAEFAAPGQAKAPAGPPAALLRQDNCWLWLGSDALDTNSRTALELLAGFLREAGLSVPFPPAAARSGIRIYRFDSDWLAVVNESRKPRTVVLPGERLATDLEGRPLSQTVLPSGRVRVSVPGDHPSSALFLRLHPVRVRPAGPGTATISEFRESRLAGGVAVRLAVQAAGPIEFRFPPASAGGTIELDGARRPLPPEPAACRVTVPAGTHRLRLFRKIPAVATP